MIKNADIICDLAWGDCGKGKVSAYLSKNKDYDYVARWDGGNNAGHTVYVNGEKLNTHLITCGIFHNIKSIIGPGCVLNFKSFMQEIEYLDESKKTTFVTINLKVEEEEYKIELKNDRKKLKAEREARRKERLSQKKTLSNSIKKKMQSN